MTGPVITLSLDHMKYTIMHYFSQRSDELEKEIGEAIDRAMKDFDFNAIVKRECDRVIQDSVRSAVATAVSQVMWQKPIEQMVAIGASRKVREAIEKSLEVPYER